MALTSQNPNFKLFVTHVETEGRLLRIWGQRQRNAMTGIQEMIRRMDERFALDIGVPTPGSNLPLGLICCAKFHKDEYYRAKVCRTLPDGTVLVHFIDYGNSEILPLSAIRLLRHHPNCSRVQTLQPLAADFVLADVMAANGGWYMETLKWIKEALCDTYITAEYLSIFGTLRLIKLSNNSIQGKIHSTSKTRRLLKLSYGDEDFGELLVRKNIAIRSSLEEMFAMRIYVFQAPRSRAQNYSSEQKNNKQRQREDSRQDCLVQNDNFFKRNDTGVQRLIDDYTGKILGQLFRARGKRKGHRSPGHHGKRNPTRRQRRRQKTEYRRLERRRSQP